MTYVGRSGSDPVVHFAYSDGLVNVSVFEERGHLSAARSRAIPVRPSVGVRSALVRGRPRS